jgi:hypothetical protein
MINKIGLLVFLSVLLFNCAQQVPPTGGKQDMVPPNLISSLPENKTVNYKGTTFQLAFDEYVIVDNLMQKLTITPNIENPYTFKLKGTEILLKFKKPFADSTTYTLNFGDGIKAFAERIPAKNLKFVFSTGAVLDSGSVYGNIKDIQTDKPVLDALVGLYELNDSLNPEKQKPYYFSRTDSSGNFAIENIQLNSYKLIAIDDKNRNLLYNSKDERIAYIDSPIKVGTDSTLYSAYLFHSDMTEPRIQRTIPKVNSYTVVFNKNMERVGVNFNQNDSIPYYLETANQLKFYKPENYSADSMLVNITAVDSIGNTMEAEQKITFMTQRGKDQVVDPFSIKTLPVEGKPLPKLTQNYQFIFNKPVREINPELVTIIQDSTTQETLAAHRIEWNYDKTILTIGDTIQLRDTLKIEINPGAIIGVEGDTLKAIKLAYPLLKEEAYGIIRGEITGADTISHIIVQLLDSRGDVIQTSYTKKYSFIRVQPGEYTIRAIVDNNGNKRWDTGVYIQNKQPEPIYFLPDKLVVKSNFEYENINIAIDRK